MGWEKNLEYLNAVKNTKSAVVQQFEQPALVDR
jgi:hypothetical protein